jgi:hypothetical protein
MDILSVILLVALVVAGFLVYNLYSKVYRQEVIIESQIDYLRNVSNVIVESKLYIDKLDEKGIFRADDEVGVFFNFMKEIQENINSYRLPENYGKRKE